MDSAVASELLRDCVSIGGAMGFYVGGVAFVVGYGFAVLLGMFNFITK